MILFLFSLLQILPAFAEAPDTSINTAGNAVGWATAYTIMALQKSGRAKRLPSEGFCQVHDAAGTVADSPCAHLTLSFLNPKQKDSVVRVQTDENGRFQLPRALARAEAIRIQSATFAMVSASIVQVDAQRERIDLVVRH